MAKKKADDAKKGLPDWLGTYGDLVTLLLTFFVLMYAMSTLDVVKFQEVAASMNNSISIISQGGSSGVNDMLGSGIMEMPNVDNSINDSKEQYEGNQKELKQMASDFKTYFAQNDVSQEVQVDVTDQYVKINFPSGILFDSGKANLKPAILPILDVVSEQLKKYPNNDIRIEGHTDSDPINSPQFPNNWYLSSARAISVGDYFTSNKGLSPDNIVAVGFGEYRPLAPNDTLENKAKNRVVEIKVYTVANSEANKSLENAAQDEVTANNPIPVSDVTDENANSTDTSNANNVFENTENVNTQNSTATENAVNQ